MINLLNRASRLASIRSQRLLIPLRSPLCLSSSAAFCRFARHASPKMKFSFSFGFIFIFRLWTSPPPPRLGPPATAATLSQPARRLFPHFLISYANSPTPDPTDCAFFSRPTTKWHRRLSDNASTSLHKAFFDPKCRCSLRMRWQRLYEYSDGSKRYLAGRFNGSYGLLST